MSDIEDAGYVGIITSNAFMKREYGKKFVEDFIPTIDLTHVIDTSGAYIPGHGTPTVILLGRARAPVGDTVRRVSGIRGESSKPVDPSQGLVWRSIVRSLEAMETADAFAGLAARMSCKATEAVDDDE